MFRRYPLAKPIGGGPDLEIVGQDATTYTCLALGGDMVGSTVRYLQTAVELVSDPVLTDIPAVGEHMLVDIFKRRCLNTESKYMEPISDDTGYGYFATRKHMVCNREITKRDIILNAYLEEKYPYVVWFLNP